MVESWSDVQPAPAAGDFPGSQMSAPLWRRGGPDHCGGAGRPVASLRRTHVSQLNEGPAEVLAINALAEHVAARTDPAMAPTHHSPGHPNRSFRRTRTGCRTIPRAHARPAVDRHGQRVPAPTGSHASSSTRHRSLYAGSRTARSSPRLPPAQRPLGIPICPASLSPARIVPGLPPIAGAGNAVARPALQPFGIVVVDFPSRVDSNQLLRNRLFILTAGFLAGTLAIVVFYLITTRLILQPVRVLQETAEKVSQGISTSAPTSTPATNSSSSPKPSMPCWPI